MPAKCSISRSTSSIFDGGKGRQVQHVSGVDRRGKTPQGAAGEEKTLDGSSDMSSSALVDSHEDKTSSEEVADLLELFAKSRADCDAYCYSSPPSKEKEKEIVAMVRERAKRLQTLLAEKKLVLLNSNKERNVRVPAKSRLRIVSVFSPVASETADTKDVAKTRVERHKILITLPPGGNRAVAERPTFNHSEISEWTTLKHSFDSRPSVRELLLKSRVCRSVMNVNQKNINFGRISTSSKNLKRLRRGRWEWSKLLARKKFAFNSSQHWLALLKRN
uniref:Uncharacterized protein n=1 Tax=Hyaloperonospora arabidopsidis (strain Emoy2) TaxID=559515 RepID=M4B6S8_HYAAE